MIIIGSVSIIDSDGSAPADVVALEDGKKALLVELNGMIPSTYDYISLSYTGSDLTGVVFRIGGALGTTIATLVLAYSGGNLVSVTKT